MTFWETIERGEYIMFALALIVVVCVIILGVRSRNLNKRKKRIPKLMQRVRDYVVEGDVDNALQLCDATDISSARVIKSGIKKMGSPIGDIKAAMTETSMIEKEGMSQGTRWLYTFAVISPLLGLGGTLVGIIDRLRDLGDNGAGVDISTVCAAIAPTIVTTVAGLGVGILALICLTILEGTVSSAKRRLDEVGNEFEELLNQPA